MRAQRKEPEEPLVLEVTAGPLKGQMFNKRMQRVTVGRTKKSHVALKDSAVSQKHAEFRYDGAWCITDSGSSNGTFLNGQALNEEELRQLKEGDVIVFGEESTVKVSFSEHSASSMTVECYLRRMCEQLSDSAREGVEQHVQSLWDEFHTYKRNVLGAAA